VSGSHNNKDNVFTYFIIYCQIETGKVESIPRILEVQRRFRYLSMNWVDLPYA